MSKTIFLFAGEKSGDLHGSHLIKELHFLNPNLGIYGVGGEEMRKERFNCLLPSEEFQVMGFIDVFLKLPKLFRLFRSVLTMILKYNPTAVILIDYPGFNLRLADALRKRGFQGKICHYICPSVWAWGKGRIPKMAKNLDILLSILPFEKKYFEGTSLPVHFVGHPLIKIIDNHNYRSFDIPADKRLITLFPGSRWKELKRNLPLLLAVAGRLHKRYPDLYFALSASQPQFENFIHEKIAESALKNLLVFSGARSYDLMKQSHIALAKSGTVTLELALHGIPSIVVYAISTLDLFIARDLLRIRLPFYSLPNIIREKEVFPELFGPHLTEETLYHRAARLLEDGDLYRECKAECSEIAALFGASDASREAANTILTILS